MNDFLIGRYANVRAMTTMAERLTVARKHAGFASAAEAAEALGVPYPTYAGHENGSSGFRSKSGEVYARRFRVSFDWLMNGKGPMQATGERQVRLKGFVGAGQEVYQFDEDGAGWVDAPPGGAYDSEAVEVRGDSMLPLYKSGAVLYYSEQLPPDRMLGEQCIVQLTDGRVLVKMLRRGSDKGLYTLLSLNAPDIEDVTVEWAAPIDWIKPR